MNTGAGRRRHPGPSAGRAADFPDFDPFVAGCAAQFRTSWGQIDVDLLYGTVRFATEGSGQSIILAAVRFPDDDLGIWGASSAGSSQRRFVAEPPQQSFSVAGHRGRGC
jgi:hypothetical protein